MKRIIALSTLLTLAALGAQAQGNPNEQELRMRLDKVVAESRVLALEGGILGGLVKGAPYAGTEVNEVNQVLADGTRIHRETQTNVYRDGEGRMRRETPDQITIWDPVGQAVYFLDPKTMTARKGTMAMNIVTKNGTTEGGFSMTLGPGEAGTRRVVTATVTGSDEQAARARLEAMAKDQMRRVEFGGGNAVYVSAGEPAERRAAKKESLGTQMVEGVSSDGTRTTMTIEAGAIGNDRPIAVVSERWYSTELQTATMTRHTDPRSGEESFRLINIRRGEPGAYLFQVPAGYQIVEGRK